MLAKIVVECNVVENCILSSRLFYVIREVNMTKYINFLQN